MVGRRQQSAVATPWPWLFAECAAEELDDSLSVLGPRDLAAAVVPSTGDIPDLLRLAGGGEDALTVRRRHDGIGQTVDDEERARADLRDCIDRAHRVEILAGPPLADLHRDRGEREGGQFEKVLECRVDHAG